MTPAEVLRKAAEYLEMGPGWKQGTIGLHGKQRCAIGACLSSIGADHFPRGELDSVIEEAWDSVERYGGFGSLAAWNDKPGRTAEEVIAKLREVADQLEAKP